MCRETAVTLFALICLVMTGCGDSHDKVVRDYIVGMENMVNVLEGIETAEDAEKAKSELKAIGENIKTVIRRKENLGGPSPALEKTLKEKYGKQHGELVVKQMDAMVRIKLKVRMIVQTVTKDIPQLY
tara:strand:+ start:149 stop:532 length:384 start_codon:yes stop_codon:yes gene_type:complete